MPINKKILYAIIASVLLASIARAEDTIPKTPPKEPIVVNGDKVEYFHEKKQVIGSGHISIIYRDVVMTCEKVTVYLDTREAIAEGDVKVTLVGDFGVFQKEGEFVYPFRERQEDISLGLLASRFHQPFGTFSGRLTSDEGVHEVRALRGVVEEHYAKW